MIGIGKLNQIWNSLSWLGCRFGGIESPDLRSFGRDRWTRLFAQLSLISHEDLKPILILAPLFKKKARRIYLSLSYLN